MVAWGKLSVGGLILPTARKVKIAGWGAGATRCPAIAENAMTPAPALRGLMAALPQESKDARPHSEPAATAANPSAVIRKAGEDLGGVVGIGAAVPEQQRAVEENGGRESRGNQGGGGNGLLRGMI